MGHPASHTTEPLPVDAELVELPSAAQPQVRQNIIPNIEPQFKPTPPLQQEQPSENPAPVAPPPLAATPSVANNPPAPSENRGAQAIVQPQPVIPDELRQDAMNEAATARFHIAVDGSVTVELIKPTQNPRLNRLLLDTLKNWKFFPAMKEGKPVASVENIVIRVQVK